MEASKHQNTIDLSLLCLTVTAILTTFHNFPREKEKKKKTCSEYAE